MKKLVVSDTNIFIDLITIGLIGDFFRLSFDIHTVDFVIRELKRCGQKETVQAYETKKKLTVQIFTAKEINEIFTLRVSAGNKISVQDCSIWFCAKKIDAAILTGDRALTLKARSDGIEVHGILYILDQLVKQSIIEPTLASEKLSELAKNNKRLPDKLVNELICKWNNSVSDE